MWDWINIKWMIFLEWSSLGALMGYGLKKILQKLDVISKVQTATIDFINRK